MACIEQQGLSPATAVNLRLTDDGELRRLNHQFRGLDRPTDVLSFPAAPPPPGAPKQDTAGGDIAISVDAVQRQARDLGHTPDDEMCILFVHGLLHLAGYDHESDAEHRAMEAAAAAILTGA